MLKLLVWHGEVVKCRICNAQAPTYRDSLKALFISLGSVLWQVISEPQPAADETDHTLKKVIPDRDTTESNVEKRIKHNSTSILKPNLTKQKAEIQDQTARSVQSDLGYPPSAKAFWL